MKTQSRKAQAAPRSLGGILSLAYGAPHPINWGAL